MNASLDSTVPIISSSRWLSLGPGVSLAALWALWLSPAVALRSISIVSSRRWLPLGPGWLRMVMSDDACYGNAMMCCLL